MAKAAPQGFHADSIEVERFLFEARPDKRAAGPLPAPAIRFRLHSLIDRTGRKIRVTAVLSGEDPKGGRATVVFEARIIAQFSWAEPVQTPVEEFAKLNAVAFVWPYARELVWNFSVRSGLPPLLLPILNFKGVEVQVEDSAAPTSRSAEGVAPTS